MPAGVVEDQLAGGPGDLRPLEEHEHHGDGDGAEAGEHSERGLGHTEDKVPVGLEELRQVTQEPLGRALEVDVAQVGADDRQLFEPLRLGRQALLEDLGLAAERLGDQSTDPHQCADGQQRHHSDRSPAGQVHPALHPAHRPVEGRRQDGGNDEDEDQGAEQHHEPQPQEDGDDDGGDAGCSPVGAVHAASALSPPSLTYEVREDVAAMARGNVAHPETGTGVPNRRQSQAADAPATQSRLRWFPRPHGDPFSAS